MLKPLHQFSGEVKRIQLLTQPERASYSTTSWVQVNLYADGLPLADYSKYNINLKELKKSLQGSGVYRIICCGCGDAYCDAHGELLVTITHHEDTIEWKNHGRLPDGHYYFVKKQYHAVVKQLGRELHQFLKENSGKNRLQQGDLDCANIKTFPNELWNECGNDHE